MGDVIKFPTSDDLAPSNEAPCDTEPQNPAEWFRAESMKYTGESRSTSEIDALERAVLEMWGAHGPENTIAELNSWIATILSTHRGV